MAVKLSQLALMIQQHIDKYGDSNFLIYDDYSSLYKSISSNEIYKGHGDRFVIECREEQ